MLAGFILVALVLKVHYKAMQYAFATKDRFQSGKGETLLLQTDFTRSNTVISRLIQ